MEKKSISTASPADSLRGEAVAGIVFFILADLILFGMLFVGFMVERTAQLEIFTASAKTLDIRLGMLNTIILLTSGLFMVFSVNAARAGNAKKTFRYLVLTCVIGAGFGLSKWMEYSAKIEQGITMLSNDFYMFYYALTGAHCLHFLGGIVALVYLCFRVRIDPLDKKHFDVIESVGLYWHMVDLLWIFIFPLLYLLIN